MVRIIFCLMLGMIAFPFECECATTSSGASLPIKIIKASWGRGKRDRDVTKELVRYITTHPEVFSHGLEQWILSNDKIGTSKDALAKQSWQVKLFGNKPYPGLNKTLEVDYDVSGEKKHVVVPQGSDLILQLPKRPPTVVEQYIIPQNIAEALVFEDVVAPSGYVSDNGRVVDVACGCDAIGNPTAYMLGWNEDENEESLKYFEVMKAVPVHVSGLTGSVLNMPFETLTKILKYKLDAVEMGARVYAYYVNGLSSDAWEILSDKDENGEIIPGLTCISASCKGDLAAVRSDNSEVVMFDFTKKVWTNLPGKPASLKIFKMCMADVKNIYVIGSMSENDVSIYKYDTETSNWDEMPATDKVIEFSIAMDGTLVAINDANEIYIYGGNNKWNMISEQGEKFKGVAVQNKDRVIAITVDGSVCEWTTSSKKFETLKGTTWKFDAKAGKYEMAGDSDKTVTGFSDISMNAGGMTFIKTIDGHIFHSQEIGISITPSVVAVKPAVVVTGVADPAVDISKTVKPVQRGSRTAAIRKGAIKSTTRKAATSKKSVGKQAIRSTTATRTDSSRVVKKVPTSRDSRVTGSRREVSQSSSSTVRKSPRGAQSTATRAARTTTSRVDRSAATRSTRKTPAGRGIAATETSTATE